MRYHFHPRPALNILKRFHFITGVNQGSVLNFPLHSNRQLGEYRKRRQDGVLSKKTCIVVLYENFHTVRSTLFISRSALQMDLVSMVLY
uniref:Uncharacterized protein n=1 Tax=Candidatus Kentrum sp. SD TaxID=2126332 RepID=A0A451BKP0_9GAMM|nr:MAG: hypothetical protein BECKSD772D_GA0070982_10273 [Candidatus Kentron sp. SD]